MLVLNARHDMGLVLVLVIACSVLVLGARDGSEGLEWRAPHFSSPQIFFRITLVFFHEIAIFFFQEDRL